MKWQQTARTVRNRPRVVHPRRQRLDGQQDIKEGAKVYRRKCIEALLKSWPQLESKPVGKVSKDDCLSWSRKFAMSCLVFCAKEEHDH